MCEAGTALKILQGWGTPGSSTDDLPQQQQQQQDQQQSQRQQQTQHSHGQQMQHKLQRGSRRQQQQPLPSPAVPGALAAEDTCHVVCLPAGSSGSSGSGVDQDASCIDAAHLPCCDAASAACTQHRASCTASASSTCCQSRHALLVSTEPDVPSPAHTTVLIQAHRTSSSLPGAEQRVAALRACGRPGSAPAQQASQVFRSPFHHPPAAMVAEAVEVHRLGVFRFKGSPEPVELVQVGATCCCCCCLLPVAAGCQRLASTNMAQQQSQMLRWQPIPAAECVLSTS